MEATEALNNWIIEKKLTNQKAPLTFYQIAEFAEWYAHNKSKEPMVEVDFKCNTNFDFATGGELKSDKSICAEVCGGEAGINPDLPIRPE